MKARLIVGRVGRPEGERRRVVAADARRCVVVGREASFGDELMTGSLNGGMVNPLSRLTVHSLRDLGLTVDVSAADPYALPTGPVLRTQGGFDIAAAEVLVPARGTIDPTTGEIDVFPGR